MVGSHWNAAEFLLRLRRRGVTQREFACRAGIHRSALCMYATGRRAPNAHALRRITETLAPIPELPEVDGLVATAS